MWRGCAGHFTYSKKYLTGQSTDLIQLLTDCHGHKFHLSDGVYSQSETKG